MAERHETGIAWTHFPNGYLGVERWTGRTWNPIVGCTPAAGSEKGGCRNCYARVLHDQRYAANLRRAKEFNRQRGSVTGMAGPLAIIAAREGGMAVGKDGLSRARQYDRPFAQVQLLPERLEQPLHWRNPRAVFVDSMSDLFHEDVPDAYIAAVFGVMAAAPQHIFMVLTKRPERMRAWFEWNARGDVFSPSIRNITLGAAQWLGPQFAKYAGPRARANTFWPLPNVWLGVSVEDQAAADERIPLLLDTPAAVRFVSYEPALGPLDLGVDTIRRGLIAGRCPTHDNDGLFCGRADTWNGVCADRAALDWVIVGAESGNGHRPMDMKWVADIYEQCRDAGIAWFGKQRSGSRLPLPAPYDLREWPKVVIQ